jgi:hypothetical protein
MEKDICVKDADMLRSVEISTRVAAIILAVMRVMSWLVEKTTAIETLRQIDQL